MRLADRYAVITGAGSGIGQAIAMSFAQEGATVGLVDKNHDGVSETARLIDQAGGRATLQVGDVSRRDDVERCMAAFGADFPRVDILVNNAGIGLLGTVEELSEDQWDAVMGVNVKSVFLCSKACMPMMPAPGGKIINVASVTGLVASPGRAAYCASKGAVVMLTRAMALDCASKGVNVNAICPGVVVTNMTSASLEDPDTRKEKLDKTPLGWLAEPQHIAPAAIFLASPESDFVTGACLAVDGGWSI